MKELADKLRRERAHVDELLDDVVKDQELTKDENAEVLAALEVVQFSLTDALNVCDDSE